MPSACQQRPFLVTFTLPAGEFSLNCTDDLRLGERWGRTDSRWDGSEKFYFREENCDGLGHWQR